MLADSEKQRNEINVRFEKLVAERDNIEAALSDEKIRSAKEISDLREKVNVLEERFIAEASDWEKDKIKVCNARSLVFFFPLQCTDS